MMIVGVDLSLTGTGVAAILDGTVTGTTVIRSKPLVPVTIYSTRIRLRRIVEQVSLWTRTADLVVIEALPTHLTKAGVQDRAGLMWLMLDHLIGRGHVITMVSPTALKKYATGRGTADKLSMVREADKRFEGVEVEDDNAADALWLAQMGAHWRGQPAVQMPADRSAVLAKVAWPGLEVAA